MLWNIGLAVLIVFAQIFIACTLGVVGIFVTGVIAIIAIIYVLMLCF